MTKLTVFRDDFMMESYDEHGVQTGYAGYKHKLDILAFLNTVTVVGMYTLYKNVYVYYKEN